jgi:hypothetical protein
MKYRDVEYSIVQGVERGKWMWSLSLSLDTNVKTSGQANNKPAAVIAAEPQSTERSPLRNGLCRPAADRLIAARLYVLIESSGCARRDHGCGITPNVLRLPVRAHVRREARSRHGDRGGDVAVDAACLNVRCCPHCELKPDIAPCPKSANQPEQPNTTYFMRKGHRYERT